MAACICCNQYLCRDHFIEHDYFFRSKLNDLTGQINKLDSQFETFDINKITSNYLIKLDKWRDDSYEAIEKFYEKKCAEIHRYINEILNKQEEEILDLRLKIAKMVNLQQTTNNNLKLLTSNIENLQQQINQIENISIQIDINSLIINDNLININISNSYQSDLSKLSSPYQIMDRVPLSSDAIASNNQHLLLHQNSNLYLIDENLFIIQETKWPNDWIRDMCWSQILNCFFIITINNVYLVEEKTLLIKHIQTIEGKFWQSCTCSDTSLYLSKDKWNSSIDEFSLKPSIEFIKHCERTEVRNNKQRIDSIEYNNGTIALVINDQTKQEIFIELRSIKNFDQLWLCRLSIEYSERKMQCCLLSYDIWMVVDWESSSIFHLTNNGNLKQIIKYKFPIRYINLFGKNKLIISTNDSIHFHKL
jgi:hypothetical protein